MKKADRKEALNKEYDSINRKYTTQFNIANQILTQNTANLATQQKQQDAQNQALLGYYQTQMQNENALKLDQAKFEQSLAQQAQLAKDPVTAVTNMVNEFKALGVPFVRSTQEIIKEAQDYVANGGDIGTYMSNLQKTIQTKPEYKAIMAANSAKLTTSGDYGVQII